MLNTKRDQPSDHDHDHDHDNGHGHPHDPCQGHGPGHEGCGHSHGHDLHGERGARLVFFLTVATMAAEVLAGWLYGSMALLADGWHMASHAGALGVAWFAYGFARRNAHNPAYALGAGKVNALAGFASAVGLCLVAVYMGAESSLRFFSPVPIAFEQATLVAVLGLAVNLASAWLLRDSHESHSHDHNLKAAYLHVLADVLTSVLAIAALLGGRYLGLNWLDPLMGIVGAVVISRWAVGLIRETAGILLDRACEPALAGQVRELLEQGGRARVTGLVMWRIGARQVVANVTLEDPEPRHPDHYRGRLSGVDGLARVTVEVHELSGQAPDGAGRGAGA